ncbi:hypothetical protein E2C01_016062 [Portunus trituberculatus]|uniref:Uncharacterized protein n=1 Tax=Portunus trituberculatus TaxID=210409 RepID=A0A5B7DPJ3_PORTR|nr:hypothetical protein [Portunus trituberculatus]
MNLGLRHPGDHSLPLQAPMHRPTCKEGWRADWTDCGVIAKSNNCYTTEEHAHYFSKSQWEGVSGNDDMEPCPRMTRHILAVSWMLCDDSLRSPPEPADIDPGSNTVGSSHSGLLETAVWYFQIYQVQNYHNTYYFLTSPSYFNASFSYCSLKFHYFTSFIYFIQFIYFQVCKYNCLFFFLHKTNIEGFLVRYKSAFLHTVFLLASSLEDLSVTSK